LLRQRDSWAITPRRKNTPYGILTNSLAGVESEIAPHNPPRGNRGSDARLELVLSLFGRAFGCHGRKGPIAVSVYPCSVCRGRKPGKLASAYWAWFKADGSRSAWKLRYFLDCAADSLSILLGGESPANGSQDVFACISCGSSAQEDSDPIYCTLYLPGKEPTEYAVQLCAACAVKLRAPIMASGETLPDRGGVVRGPSPSVTAWDALGLAPS